MSKSILNWLKKYWYIVVAFILISGFIFYQQRNTEDKNAKKYTVKRQNLKETVTLSGEVDATEKVDLQFQSGGRLAWVGVKEGDYVKKGQLIASLDQRQLQKSMQKFLNTYVKERLIFDQQQLDVRPVVIGALSTDAQHRLIQAAQEAQYDLNNSVLDVEVQNISVEYANLFTPIEGIVDHVDTPFAGVNLSVASPSTFRIVNPKTLYFSVGADQTEVVELQEGKTGEIIFDSHPDERITATIRSIAFSPKAGETGTVYEMKLDFENQDVESSYKYRLGMTGDATFVLREVPNVLSIPSSAIKVENGKSYVFKSTNGKKEKAFITTGESIDTNVEITSGLKDGDVIYD